MIKIIDRSMEIPFLERKIGCVGDNKIEFREFELPLKQSKLDMTNLDYKLDYVYASKKYPDIIDLQKQIIGDKVVLHFEILKRHVLEAGICNIQIRAFNDDEQVWHSKIDYFIVDASLSATNEYVPPLPTEFEQMETNVTLMRNEVIVAKSDIEDIKKNVTAAKNSVELSEQRVEKIAEEIVGLEFGDMLKSVYDTNNDGKVNRAEVADKTISSLTFGVKTFDGSADQQLNAEDIGAITAIPDIYIKNTDIATKEEAVNGESNKKIMTALRVKEAISALAVTSVQFNTHVIDEVKHIVANERLVWNGKAEKSDITTFNGTALVNNNTVDILAAGVTKSPFTVTFVAPFDFNVDNIYRINNVVRSLSDLNNEPLEDAWKKGSLVTFNVTGDKAFFKAGGSGFPEGWNLKYTATAATNIIKNSPIVKKTYGNWDEDMERVLEIDNIPTRIINATSFDPSSTYLAVGGNQTSYLTIYKINGNTFNALTFSDIEIGSIITALKFDPTGEYLAIGCTSAPFLFIYKRDGDTFTKLPNPSVMPTATVKALAFDPIGTYLAASFATSTIIYKKDGAIFTNLPNSIENTAGTINSLDFSRKGNFFAIAHGGFPYLSLHKRIGDTFNKLPNPSVVPPGLVLSVAFDPNGDYLAAGCNKSPFLCIYKIYVDDFVRLPDPSVIPTHFIQSVDFDPSGSYLSAGCNAAPFLFMYKIDGDTFIKLQNPSVIVNGATMTVDFSGNNTYLAAGRAVSPFLMIYKTQLKDIISQFTTFDLLPTELIGLSLQNANMGEPCKVNLFPILNDYEETL